MGNIPIIHQQRDAHPNHPSNSANPHLGTHLIFLGAGLPAPTPESTTQPQISTQGEFNVSKCICPPGAGGPNCKVPLISAPSPVHLGIPVARACFRRCLFACKVPLPREMQHLKIVKRRVTLTLSTRCTIGDIRRQLL